SVTRDVAKTTAIQPGNKHSHIGWPTQGNDTTYGASNEADNHDEPAHRRRQKTKNVMVKGGQPLNQKDGSNRSYCTTEQAARSAVRNQKKDEATQNSQTDQSIARSA